MSLYTDMKEFRAANPDAPLCTEEKIIYGLTTFLVGMFAYIVVGIAMAPLTPQQLAARQAAEKAERVQQANAAFEKAHPSAASTCVSGFAALNLPIDDPRICKRGGYVDEPDYEARVMSKQILRDDYRRRFGTD